MSRFTCLVDTLTGMFPLEYEIVYIHNSDDQVMAMNALGCSLLGLDQRSLQGLTLDEFEVGLPPNSPKTFTEENEGILSQFRAKDGDLITVDVSVRAVDVNTPWMVLKVAQVLD